MRSGHNDVAGARRNANANAAGRARRDEERYAPCAQLTYFGYLSHRLGCVYVAIVRGYIVVKRHCDTTLRPLDKNNKILLFAVNADYQCGRG